MALAPPECSSRTERDIISGHDRSYRIRSVRSHFPCAMLVEVIVHVLTYCSLYRHIMTTYPSVSLIAEPHLAAAVHNDLSTPLYTTKDTSNIPLHSKTDLVATFGGDGTILRASALFSTATSVPPILSFSMGTLGFLGEWKFDDYKRAFREAYMSGAPGTGSPSLEPLEPLPHAINPSDNGPHGLQNGWAILRGKSLGSNRSARVLLRHRLKVGIFESTADQNERINGAVTQHAMNEVLLHRGTHPHLTHITVLVNGRFLTEAVGDGMLISTPTGSTAYSLSAGGSIIHPLVPSLLLTPICPRSLSFRPLVLPANVEVTLRMGLKNRSKEVEVTVDGVRRPGGMSAGMELRVIGEEVLRGDSGWTGGVPCLMKGGQTRGDDSWVGGLNGLLKFNYPFGEED